MLKPAKVAVLLATLSPAAAAAYEADSIRCDGRLISPGAPIAKVAALCGQPDRKEVERVPVRGRGAEGASIRIGETTIERWTYYREGRFPAEITFDDGEIRTIRMLTSP